MTGFGGPSAACCAACPTWGKLRTASVFPGAYYAPVDVLVIGGSGFLGFELIQRAQLAGHRVTATYHSSVPADSAVQWRRLDIRRRHDVAALAADTRPDVIINAAYRQTDWETTADGAMHVALAATAASARLVHVSSDVVFSGNAPSYDERQLPDPVTPYGAAKAAAETAVKGITRAAVIARTSLIIGDGGGSPPERLVHALAAGTATGVLYTDQVRCPVHVTDLASALLELAAAAATGIRHLAGGDAVSRYELGVLIAARDGLDPARLPAGRAPADRPGPLDLRLDSTRTQAQLTTRLRGARQFLALASR